ncbi:uncharacterized protein LOC134627133 [Pelmatolapia mariae]|uniref:uncharacterized protein LOC134627133 n=1 Tax=Pelmatolapia mariae TaxID=158779 RepID=UPI002FE6A46D
MCANLKYASRRRRRRRRSSACCCGCDSRRLVYLDKVRLLGSERSNTMAKVSIETRHKVVSLRQQGLSQAEISRQTGVSKRAVQALLQKHKKTGTVEDQKRSGRPRKLSKADERLIKLTFLENRTMSSSAITSELAVTSGTLVDPSTVRRCLARSGLNGRRGSKKQLQMCESSEDKTLSGEQKQEDLDVNKLKQEEKEEEQGEQRAQGEQEKQGEQKVWTGDSADERSYSNSEGGDSHSDERL